MIPDRQATTHPRSAATLPRSLNNCTDPLSRQNATSSSHVNQWSNDPRSRSNQGRQGQEKGKESFFKSRSLISCWTYSPVTSERKLCRTSWSRSSSLLGSSYGVSSC